MHVVYFLYYRLTGPGTILGLNRLNDGLQDPGHLQTFMKNFTECLNAFKNISYVGICNKLYVQYFTLTTYIGKATCS